MSSTAPRPRPAPRTPVEQLGQLRVIGMLIALVVLGPPAATAGAGAFLLARRCARGMLYLTIAAALGLSALYLFWDRFSARITLVTSAISVRAEPQTTGLQTATPANELPTIDPDVLLAPIVTRLKPHLLPLWAMLLLSAPTISLFLESTRIRQVDEVERGRHEREERTLQLAAQKARTQATDVPPVVKSQLVLGASIRGDLDWTQGRYITYPPVVLGRHLVAIGASGSGKTETSIRLAYGAAKVYGWKVFYLDCKGDEEMAARFMNAMATAGYSNIARFPDRAYDGWRGDNVALFNRLMAIVDYTEPYYRDLTKMILDLAINAPGGLPRSSEELLARLNPDALKQLYNGTVDIHAVDGIKPEHIHSAHNRYRAFFRALDGGLDGSWAFEDVDAGYVLMRGLELKDQTASIGRFMMEDFAHYVSKRKDPNQRILFIIDEFPAIAFGGANTAILFEMVRSKGAGVVVTAQSYAGMGEGADRILGAAATLLLHQCADPDKLLARAGMATTYARSISFAERGVSHPTAYGVGAGSIREQEQLKVHPNAVKALAPGECFLISGGRYAYVSVARLAPDTAALYVLPPASAHHTNVAAHGRYSAEPTVPDKTNIATASASDESARHAQKEEANILTTFTPHDPSVDSVHDW
jgi:hypothetical protein